MKEKILKIVEFIKTIPSKFKNLFISLNKEILNLKEKFKDLISTNYKLGLFHISNGNISDAKIRFLMVIKFKPDHADAHYQLARCYINELKFKKALEHLNLALNLDKSLERKIHYRIGVINQNLAENVEILPEIVQEDYDMIFKNYENLMLEQNRYTGHFFITERLKNYLKDNTDVLDLGSGTGLVGAIIASFNNKVNIYGADISKNMSKEASKLYNKNKIVYRKIDEIDLNEFNSDKKYHVITSSLTLGYINDISMVLGNIHKSLHEDGVFSFIVLEVENKNKDKEFNYEHASFGYNELYIKSLFNKNNWELLNSEIIDIFSDKTKALLMTYKKI